MTRSMTGFGAAEGAVAGGTLRVEIRTVNHKHFNAQIKTCSELQQYEHEIRDLVRRSLPRGHVSLSARWSVEPVRGGTISVDVDRARQVLDAIATLQSELNLPGEVDVGFVARQPEVLKQTGGDDAGLDFDAASRVVLEAVEAVLAMRVKEGRLLGAELERILDALETGRATIAARAPQRFESERLRLRQAISELIDGHELDEARLAQELAHTADKLDITEELVRLETHLAACREALAEAGPVGRKLGFLSQEMLREINTIGSKANDADITAVVIEMKGELERFREQLENIE